MPDDPTKAIHLLEAELANIHTLSESLERLGETIPAEVEPAIAALEAQLAKLRQAPPMA